MNERIQELALQAGLVRRGDWGMKRWEGPRSDSISDQDLEKFAELIVRECCDIVLAPHNETGFTISMDLCKFSTRQAIDRAAQSGGLKVHTQGISKEIKKHFGVEE